MTAPDASGSSFRSRTIETIRTFPPAYFSLVMATGIIAIAAHLLEMHQLAVALFWLNLLFYAVLWSFTAARILVAGKELLHDLTDHQRAPGFFTTVAASCIVASGCEIVVSHHTVALLLWGLSIILWLGLTYTIFTSFTIKENKPPLDKGISGAWLLSVVATQAIAVTSTLVAHHWDQPDRMAIHFLALAMWLAGGMLYIWMISLIFYRYTFFRFSPDDLTPPYWINMGAMAISTLAGSLLIRNAAGDPYLTSLLPFLKGFTLFYWATGTWWIPMLLTLGIWRHLYKRFPLKYDPLYWGLVFPLGMYAVSTVRMAQAMELNFLHAIPHIFFYIAVAAWLVVFIGMVRRMVGSGKRRSVQ